MGREHINNISDHVAPNWFSSEQPRSPEQPTYTRANNFLQTNTSQQKNSKMIKLNYGSPKVSSSSDFFNPNFAATNGGGMRSQEENRSEQPNLGYPSDSPEMLNSKYAGMKYERRVDLP